MEAEVHCLDTGNRIQVDIAMQAADEEKVDEQKKNWEDYWTAGGKSGFWDAGTNGWTKGGYTRDEALQVVGRRKGSQSGNVFQNLAAV